MAKLFTSWKKCVLIRYSGRYKEGSSPLYDASRGGLVLHSLLRSSPGLIPNALYTNACCFLDSACISQRLPSTFITPSVFSQIMVSEPNLSKRHWLFPLFTFLQWLAQGFLPMLVEFHSVKNKVNASSTIPCEPFMVFKLAKCLDHQVLVGVIWCLPPLPFPCHC